MVEQIEVLVESDAQWGDKYVRLELRCLDKETHSLMADNPIVWKYIVDAVRETVKRETDFGPWQ